MIGEELPPPFSCLINVRRLPRKGQHVKYSAPDDIREKIAEENELISVERFDCTCLVTPWKKDGVKLVGEVKADLVQPCAISSEPLEAKVREPFEMLFVPDGSKLSRPMVNGEGELIFDADGPDLPDTFVGDSLDLAKVWLEFFVLGLDLYAKLDGAVLATDKESDSENVKRISPFAALAGLKKH